MVLRAQIVLAASIIVSFAFPSAAVCEPISFLFTVSAGGKTFPLVATFDDQVSRTNEGPNFYFEQYGRVVRFSPVPLVAPSPYAGRPLVDDFSNPFFVAGNGFELSPILGIIHSGLLGGALYQPAINFSGGRDYQQEILLYAESTLLAARPELTPRTLAQLVGTPMGEPTFLFQVAKWDQNTGEFIDGLAYHGVAQFRGQVDSPDPVPEPATLLLVATGVAGVAWRRRRRRAKSGDPEGA